MSKFTPNQLAAITAQGDTIVVAGAGAGKTGTLVERCIRILLDETRRTSVRNILVVTFTEAAAAEVRDRIRRKLEEAASVAPENEWIQQQIAGLDNAHISTLHSFCLTLLRESFYLLDLDPAVSVLAAEQAEMLFHEAFDEILGELLGGTDEFPTAFQGVLRTHFNGWEKPLREFIRKLHHYTQTRPAPERWFDAQLERLASRDASHWRAWYDQALNEWCAWWAPYLASLPAENENAGICAQLLQTALKKRDTNFLRTVLARDECWEKKRKKKDRAPFGNFFDEAVFLEALSEPNAVEDDWESSRAPLLILLKFAQQFAGRFDEAKRARGVVDFHDLEQGALRILWDESAKIPSPIALRWRERLEAVFVDEYQDINAAQDLIISAISRPTPGNRFLVGDIKQSIYGFRQADPTIFRNYLHRAENGCGWKPVFLSDNFRSHEGILRFVNPLFAGLMREQLGGVSYDANAALKFGAPDRRKPFAQAPADTLPIELHLVTKAASSENGEEDAEDLESTEFEARIVAQRLRELKESGHQIYHQKEGVTRGVEWRDMVVLLRAATGKVETYAKAFAAIGVPLDTKRDGFFSAQEVLDLCNVLTILDNPQQDLPLIAVLRSPLVGLTANEFAMIRAQAGPYPNFWIAVQIYLDAKKENDLSRKLEQLMTCYLAWRSPRECFSLAQRLETILADTGYAEWLLSQPRGRQRYANVQQLIRVARQFDDARGESLYLFLRHLEILQETAGDIEPANVSEENSVRLMTVHQSKGLEFPVVAVADLGKRFNTLDQNGSVLLHEQYGLCAMIKAPKTGLRYPSLPLWLAQREQRLNSIGEEMRVLYVALTRAENLLLLFGSASEKQIEKWSAADEVPVYPQQLLKSRSWLEWVAQHCARTWPNCLGASETAVPLNIQHHSEAPPARSDAACSAVSIDADELAATLARLNSPYPHTAACKEPAKTSVSAFRNRFEPDEEEAAPFCPNLNKPGEAQRRGTATHTLLQRLDLSGDLTPSGLQAQAQELTTSGVFQEDEAALIDFERVSTFWRSRFGADLLARLDLIRRELPFTFRLRNDDLAALGLEKILPVAAGEFVVVQGVADLVVLQPAEIWLLDFKTDECKPDDVSAKSAEYRSQIALYSLALERIYNKPVTRRGLYFIAARALEWLQ
ncbi:MAG TPA: UvrD-helicase domain-containing protein [Verrucomicrobiae bacterium]